MRQTLYKKNLCHQRISDTLRNQLFTNVLHLTALDPEADYNSQTFSEVRAGSLPLTCNHDRGYSLSIDNTRGTTTRISMGPKLIARAATFDF